MSSLNRSHHSSHLPALASSKYFSIISRLVMLSPLGLRIQLVEHTEHVDFVPAPDDLPVLDFQHADFRPFGAATARRHSHQGRADMSAALNEARDYLLF